MEKTALTQAIAKEIYKAFELLDAPVDLLCVVGSYGDSLEDADVLDLLVDFNKSGQIFHERNTH